MISPLSLSNVLTVILAAICVWTVTPQARGGMIKVWRLAVPPAFATVQALVLLAGVFEVSLVSDALWLAAAIMGGLLGRMRGGSLPVELDRARDLVRLKPSIDAHIATLGLMALAIVDFVSASLEYPIVSPDFVAAAAAFCAGYMAGRALSIAVRATRSGDIRSESTPAGTSLPPS